MAALVEGWEHGDSTTPDCTDSRDETVVVEDGLGASCVNVALNLPCGATLKKCHCCCAQTSVCIYISSNAGHAASVAN